MANIFDYPITTPYGQVDGYPLNNGFHTGIDYGAPVGTPVVVNGVQIALSGNTGASTGPHCHVGHWNGGTVLNPGVGGGKTVNGGKVSQVGYDDTNGNFVRVADADGTNWVYLHLSKVTSSAGQVLKGVGEVMDEAGVDLAFKVGLNRPATANEISQWVGKSPNLVLQTIFNNNVDFRAAAAQYPDIKAKYDALVKDQGSVLAPGKYVVK